MRKLLILVATFALLSCGQEIVNVEEEVLGENNGSEIITYTLTNKAGNVLKVTNFGAKIVSIEVPDKFGNMDNVTNGVNSLDAIVKGDLYGGATIGRFTNRIANAKFTLDDVEYTLPANNGANTLHGGPNGWYTKVWDAEILKGKDPAVKFTYVSPDMEEGFPGTVTASVTYTWTDNNEAIIDYLATTDKKTVINLTNHAYFNLHGTGKGYIFEHVLTIKASAYTPLYEQIPTGEIIAVQGTPYDFNEPKTVGRDIGETFGDIVFRGYDDNYVLDNKEEVDVIVYEPKTGRVMEVITSEPGIQVYSGNSMGWLRSLEAENGAVPTTIRSGLALETQHFPDSPNQPNFPTTVLNPGQKFESRTIYRFSIREN